MFSCRLAAYFQTPLGAYSWTEVIGIDANDLCFIGIDAKDLCFIDLLSSVLTKTVFIKRTSTINFK